MKSEKSCFNKIILTIFFLLTISYNNCSYAFSVCSYSSRFCDKTDVQVNNKVLFIEKEIITKKIAKKIARELQKSSIKRLTLSGVKFAQGSFEIIINAVGECSTLTELEIRWCYKEIQDNHAIKIAEALLKKRIPLTTLDLSGNFIGPYGITKIITVVQEIPTLSNLNLYGNDIHNQYWGSMRDYDLMQALAVALRDKTTPFALHLGANDIREEGAQKLAKDLQGKPFTLDYENIGSKDKQEIANLLLRNQIDEFEDDILYGSNIRALLKQWDFKDRWQVNAILDNKIKAEAKVAALSKKIDMLQKKLELAKTHESAAEMEFFQEHIILEKKNKELASAISEHLLEDPREYRQDPDNRDSERDYVRDIERRQQQMEEEKEWMRQNEMPRDRSEQAENNVNKKEL